MCLCIALGGGAYAAVGGFVGSDGKIRGCVSKKGQLTVLKTGQRCKRGLRAIAWNQVGQTGPAGSTGQTGPQGPRGFTGATGPSTGSAGGDLQGSYPNPTLKSSVLTGSRIDESTLSQVPSAASAISADSATTASTASDASALGGLAPDQYFLSSNVKRVEGEAIQQVAGFSPTVQLVTMGGMTLVMDCSYDSGTDKQKIRIGIASLAPGAHIRWHFMTGNSPGAGDSAVSAPPNPTIFFERSGGSGTNEKGMGTFIYRDNAQTITMPFWYNLGYFQSNCTVSGTATRAGP